MIRGRETEYYRNSSKGLRLEHMDVMFVTITTNDSSFRSPPINCKLALSNTFFSKRNNGGISHTHNGTSPNGRKQIDLEYQVQDIEIVPQPSGPAKAGSDHNVLYIKVRLSGHFAAKRQIRRPTKRREFDRKIFISEGKCRERVVARVISTLNQLIHPRNTSGMVEVFTSANIDAVEKEVPPPARRDRSHGWCESAKSLAAFISA